MFEKHIYKINDIFDKEKLDTLDASHQKKSKLNEEEGMISNNIMKYKYI